MDPSFSSIRNCPFESYHREKYPVVVPWYPETSQYFPFFLVFISSEISNGPACANLLTNTGKVQNTFNSIQDCKTKEKKLGVKNSPSLLAFDPVTVLDYVGFLSRRCDVSSAVLQSKHCTVTSRRFFRLDVSHSASSVSGL